MAGWRVEVTGLRQIMDALAEVDKKAAREITKRITDAAKSVVIEASYISPGRNPISNWGTWFARNGRDLSFSPTMASAGYKVRRSNFRKRGVSAGIGWDVYQTNPGGAIFELLGKSSTPFVETIADRFAGKRPRVLIPAYYAGVPEGLAEDIADQLVAAARRAGLD